tara:strand:- start:53351 stop:53560 length:210 start_codon:yes stop_codon:yes gene_type:complete
LSGAQKKFLNSQELALRLGVSISTIYFWVSQNKVPYFKMGKHNRFDYEEVLAHFKNKTLKSDGGRIEKH